LFLEIALPIILILAVTMAFSFPIYISLLAGTIYMQIFVNQMPLQNIFTGMFEALTQNSLLAVPFFIVAGDLLATSSLGGRLVDVFTAFLKKIPGGLAISCIGANAIFGAISGSAPAATATFGKILWGPLKKNYGEEEAAGLITSSGSLSSIIPPALPLIMYAIVTETSLATLFMAGLMPGILCVIILFVYLFLKHRKETLDVVHIKGERTKALKRSIPAMILPIIILGGIYGGFCSPTEAGAISALYAGLVSLFLTRDLDLRAFMKVFFDCVKTVGSLFILIAASNVFSQALTVTQAPRALEQAMSNLSPLVFLIVINITLLIMGLFFNPSAANLIIAPILVPVAINLGIDVIHLGVIFAVNLSIGMFTPPFGLSLFVSQSVLGIPMIKIAKGCMPFLICYLIALVLITYIPEISLFFPRFLMG
jgi:C4-dicarboxylate transporter DctM subunit